MTESEWLSCTDPQPMLEFLNGKASERKLRLFLIACARVVWDKMTDPTMRRGVEQAERLVDGLASYAEMDDSHTEIYKLTYVGASMHEKASMMGVSFDEWSSMLGLSLSCGFIGRALELLSKTMSWHHGRRLTGDRQPDIFRDMFGNPFRRIIFDESWRQKTVVEIAQRIYDEKRFEDMAVLADALEEAGCTNAEILNHCRGPGPHVRGCWVVDAILGKD